MRGSGNEYDRQILSAIASGHKITQRSLSSDLGVALGLTNLLMRRLIAKGYVRMAGMGTRRVRYLMTAAGWHVLRRTTRLSLETTVRLYTDVREQIRESLSSAAARCVVDPSGQKRVVFYGAGDVAEIAYVSLQRTDLTLVGVVDDRRRGRFFDLMISRPEVLTASAVDGVPYGHLIIASMRNAEAIQAGIKKRGVPAERVSCISWTPGGLPPR